MDRSDVQETLVSLYLRLNGYFASGFIVQAPHAVKTEMDVLAVRFPKYQEPEREIQCCPRLAVPANHIDFLVGEVKGGSRNVNFNTKFRDDPEAICTVLRRFGAFDQKEIDRVCSTAPAILEPAKVRNLTAFPELDVSLSRDVPHRTAKLRFVPFAAEQRRESNDTRPYIFEDDLLNFVWTCFRPEQRRPRCDVIYNYELWGLQFAEMVQHFKNPSRRCPGSIEDLYSVYGV